MKNLLFTLIALSVIFVSCSDPDPTIPPDSVKGSIKLKIELSHLTRTEPELTNLFLILTDDEEVLEFPIPKSGVVSDIKPGVYILKVTTHKDGMPQPGFGDFYWEGEVETVSIQAGQMTEIAVNCAQKNGGVSFVYDSDLEGADVVPTLTTSDQKSLVYRNRTSQIGYFPPGEIKLTVTVDGKQFKIAGEEFRIIEVKAGVNLKITLQRGNSERGSIDIEITFEPVLDEELTLDIYEEDEPQIEYIELNNIFRAEYMSPYDPNTPAQFYLDIDHWSEPDGFMIRGFTTNQPDNLYPLAQGRYSVTNQGLRKGEVFNDIPTGTFGYLFSSSGLTDYWLAESAVMEVTYSGNLMTVDLIMSGSDKSGRAYKNRGYTYTGPLPEWDFEIEGPPGDVVWEDIPEVEFRATGRPRIDQGPEEWSGFIYKMDNPAGKYLVVTHWGYYDRKEGAMVMEYPMFIDYINGRLYVDRDVQLYYGDNGRSGFWFSCFDVGEFIRLNGGEFEVQFDSVNKILDFSGNTVEWDEVTYDTFMAYHRMTLSSKWENITDGYAPRIELTEIPSPPLEQTIVSYKSKDRIRQKGKLIKK